MIRKLKRRFVLISLVALTVAMVLVVGIVNLTNWLSVRAELKDTLAFISENDLRGPMAMADMRPLARSKHERNTLSESNWFTVYYSASSGEIRNINFANAVETDEDSARLLAEKARQNGKTGAFIGDYLYTARRTPSGSEVITFLNCETRLSAVRRLVSISFLACLGGILLAFAILALASRRAVMPTIRNMEKQKQFITNASHELKTPLTVIAANMELLGMDVPDNTWVKGTLKQTGIMRRLVDELVYLSRLEEENAPLSMESLRLDSLLREAAEPFMGMAEFTGRDMKLDIADGLYVKGDYASLQRLASTLLDNALKYASGDGAIELKARAEGRWVRFTLSNPVSEPLTSQQCAQLFDRFYRADPSRSKDKKSGFGIGLAIAAAIVEKHSGRISAEMQGSRLAFICHLPKGIKS